MNIIKKGVDTFNDDSDMVDFFQSKRPKVDTHIKVLDKRTGEVDITCNEVIYGGRLAFISDMAKQAVVASEQHYTLNESLGSNAARAMGIADWTKRSMCLFIGGNGGAKGGGELNKVHPDDVIQRNTIPMRCRKVNADLPPAERAKYGLRAIKTFKNGAGIDTEYICYYGKVPTSVTIKVTQGEEGAAYNPKLDVQNTSNINLHDTHGNPIISTVVAVVFDLDLVQEDFFEFYNETGTLTDDSGFSELSMVYGLETTIVGAQHIPGNVDYQDFIGCECYTAFNLAKRPTDAISQGYSIKYAIGG